MVLLGALTTSSGHATPVASADAPTATAVFAGGCFWSAEADFEHLPGVVGVISGYMGGTEKNPTYEQVSSGKTRYAEAVRVEYNSAILSYDRLVNYFFHHIDPTQPDGQFCDVGPQYRAVVFFETEAQRRAAELVRGTVARALGAPVTTELEKATVFWPADDSHQDYYLKHVKVYQSYRTSCGRDARIFELYGQKKK